MEANPFHLWKLLKRCTFWCTIKSDFKAF